MNAALLEDENKWNTVMCMAYLPKYGNSLLLTVSQRRERRKSAMLQVTQGVQRHKEFTDIQKSIFQSENNVGSSFWTRDVRNFVADSGRAAIQLMPPQEHLKMQMKRAYFVLQ